MAHPHRLHRRPHHHPVAAAPPIPRRANPRRGSPVHARHSLGTQRRCGCSGRRRHRPFQGLCHCVCHLCSAACMRMWLGPHRDEHSTRLPVVLQVLCGARVRGAEHGDGDGAPRHGVARGVHCNHLTTRSQLQTQPTATASPWRWSWPRPERARRFTTQAERAHVGDSDTAASRDKPVFRRHRADRGEQGGGATRRQRPSPRHGPQRGD
mmetsp:Transcript_8692/g.18862  ORF Transcript_8692/g.18862 Transcript_8692/m.18862 type:complete len:209 (+) Transcript_8692:865-1491(+)